jgi:hypothetical protein
MRLFTNSRNLFLKVLKSEKSKPGRPICLASDEGLMVALITQVAVTWPDWKPERGEGLFLFFENNPPVRIN